tara:strand:+ start:630 stop:2078 length:1449 start_codon:yes stop_codon:yes gene_type:complete
MHRVVIALILASLISAGGVAQSAAINERQRDEAAAIDAYIYLYPLVTMDITRLQMTNVAKATKGSMSVPMNQLYHFRAFPDADFRTVVRPNFDTLYTSLWADMSEGPVIVSVPDSGGRYYMLPMLDMWTDVFAVPGWRTTGSGAGHFAFVPPGWEGELPEGVTRIDSPTPYAWMIGRTESSVATYPEVHKFQDGIKLSTLADWGKQASLEQGKVDPKVDMKTPPLDQVNNMPARKFFEYAATLMKLHPPHITDADIVARMKYIGLEPGKDFDYESLSPSAKAAVDISATKGLQMIKAHLPEIGTMENGWSVMRENAGVYGADYLQRATIALAGLGCNKPIDAVYPLAITDSRGKTPSGDQHYVIHFDHDKLPPVEAFWSITMYDDEGFQVANPLNRFAIGDRDKLKFNDDGSLDIFIQAASPGKDKESNWLPAPPQGTLGLTMRLYAPDRSVLDGRWQPPVLNRVDGKSSPAKLGDGLPAHQ